MYKSRHVVKMYEDGFENQDIESDNYLNSYSEENNSESVKE